MLSYRIIRNRFQLRLISKTALESRINNLTYVQSFSVHFVRMNNTFALSFSQVPFGGCLMRVTFHRLLLVSRKIFRYDLFETQWGCNYKWFSSPSLILNTSTRGAHSICETISVKGNSKFFYFQSSIRFPTWSALSSGLSLFIIPFIRWVV